MKKNIKLLILLSLLLISSCSSTNIISHKSGNDITSNSYLKSPVLVLWGTAWRKDQKEPKLREEIASKAIERFFSNKNIFSEVKIVKNISEKSSIDLSDIQAFNLNKEYGNKYSKIIFLRVEELGPTINLYLSPILFEGSTEVKLRVRILDTNSTSLDSDIYSEWKNGGPFVLKGLKTLEQDMYDNLKSIFGL